MDLQKLKKQYELITEDDSNLEEKIAYFKILLTKIDDDNEKEEISEIITELEQLNANQNLI